MSRSPGSVSASRREVSRSRLRRSRSTTCLRSCELTRPESKNTLSAVLSTEGRVVGLCWAKLKPNGPEVRDARAVRLRAKTGHLKTLKGLLPESQGHNLGLTIFYVPYWREVSPSRLRRRRSITCSSSALRVSSPSLPASLSHTHSLSHQFPLHLSHTVHTNRPG